MNGKELHQQLNELFEQNPNIDELGLISSRNSAFDSNSAFILAENNTKIGISFSCITELYSYCFNQFNIERKKFTSSHSDQILNKSLDLLTRTILFINAENITALNIRKQLILNGYNEHLKEIKLLNLIFTKHPKSGDAWTHRRWVLTNYKDSFHNKGSNSEEQTSLSIQDELKVCKRVAEIYPKNYYAWTHRFYILKNQPRDILLDDLKTIKDWINRNISDYCGYHHRYLIITTLIQNDENQNNNNNNNNQTQKEQSIDLLRNEIKMIQDLIEFYPGHESPWNYLRTLTRYYCTLDIKDKEQFLAEQFVFTQKVIQDRDSSYYDKQISYCYRYLITLIYQLGFSQSAEEKHQLLNNLKNQIPNQSEFWEYLESSK
ncbi:hypothetical protein DLAC_01418 [Tieghemostelium lacteum]|uniref:Uncharacterized protein n=1 Tax=Tieghemostelium lacteum TaxID=361077 RepID=A0A152A5U3_TIELA|nr:hypothetical protein DLAC_01418 [Tieghemostelium lacteum]|eukprot:KYR01437.1 hypothetical protein DLAC_01418 [Tieghemostelium lacteum]